MPEHDLMTRLQRLGGADEPAAQQARERARDRLRELGAPPARGAGRSGRPALRGRRPMALALVLVGALVAAGAGYAALHGGGPDLAAGVACQDRASLTPDAMTQAPLDGRDAVAICAELWRRGHVDGTPAKPPSLQACVVPRGGGVIRVMPGASVATCEGLGLESRPHAGGSPSQRRFAAFQADVVRSVHRGPPRCVPPSEGRHVVRAAIAEHRMAGWRVETGAGIRGEGFSARRPCVSIALDGRRRVVVLVPMTADPP